MSQTSAAVGPIYSRIHANLQVLAPTYIEILDDSPKHQGHAAMQGLKPVETHFRVIVVSDKFEKLPLVKRHRMVYSLLDQEMKDGIHALQLFTKTPVEFLSAKP